MLFAGGHTSSCLAGNSTDEPGGPNSFVTSGTCVQPQTRLAASQSAYLPANLHFCDRSGQPQQTLPGSAHVHRLAAARHAETRVQDVAGRDGDLAVVCAALVPAAARPNPKYQLRVDTRVRAALEPRVPHCQHLALRIMGPECGCADGMDCTGSCNHACIAVSASASSTRAEWGCPEGQPPSRGRMLCALHATLHGSLSVYSVVQNQGEDTRTSGHLMG